VVDRFVASLKQQGLDKDLVWLPEEKAVSPYMMRHAAGARYLSTLSPDEPCVLCDSRDVVFQAKPKWRIEGLQLHQEASRACIGGSSINALWVYQLFGQSRLEQLKYNPIINCGIISGSAGVLSRLLHDIAALGNDKCHPAQDQGIVNHLVYGKYRNTSTFFTNETGPVLHCSYLVVGEFIEDSGILVRADGHIPTIVHQYDRLYGRQLG